jgi:hypothetical protein
MYSVFDLGRSKLAATPSYHHDDLFLASKIEVAWRRRS